MKREEYIDAMQPLLKKSLIRYAGNNKHIKIKFSKKGIAHIANDVLTKKLGISKAELSKLDNHLRDATYIKSSSLHKDRSDNVKRFYYFKDKSRNLYYNIAESRVKLENGRETIHRFLYSITNNIK